jgi:hypothetical protein
MSSFEWVGAIAGLVGGLTGLIGFGLQVWFHFATGPRVKVSTFWATNVSSGRQLFNFTIINSGRMTANIESISIEYSNTDHLPSTSLLMVLCLGLHTRCQSKASLLQIG